jgi:hypothetical protein
MAKKKARPPTPEELKLGIKHERAAQWLHSEPLFGLLQTQQGTELLMVDSALEKEIVLCFIIDPVDYSAERSFEIIQAFKQRYARLGWKSAVVFSLKYSFSKTPQFLDRFKHFPVFSTLPIYLDTALEFQSWANTTEESKIVIICDGVRESEFPLNAGLAETILALENHLQDLLRRQDPGLPLPLLYNYELDAPVDTARFNPTQLTLKGVWGKDGPSVMTVDHHATLSIPFSGRYLRIISNLHSQARESTSRVTITFNEKPLPATLSTSLIEPDAQGNTTFEIGRFDGTYELLKSTAPIDGIITLQFTSAANSPIVFHGLRIG